VLSDHAGRVSLHGNWRKSICSDHLASLFWILVSRIDASDADSQQVALSSLFPSVSFAARRASETDDPAHNRDYLDAIRRAAICCVPRSSPADENRISGALDVAATAVVAATTSAFRLVKGGEGDAAEGNGMTSGWEGERGGRGASTRDEKGGLIHRGGRTRPHAAVERISPVSVLDSSASRPASYASSTRKSRTRGTPLPDFFPTLTSTRARASAYSRPEVVIRRGQCAFPETRGASRDLRVFGSSIPRFFSFFLFRPRETTFGP